MPTRSWMTVTATLCWLQTMSAAGCSSEHGAASDMHGGPKRGSFASAAQMPSGDSGDLGRVPPIIVERTNAVRRQEGRSAVRVDDKLTATAQEFADHMARTDRLAHDADGNTPSGRATAHGYDYCLIFENIADESTALPATTDEIAEQFVKGWMASPGHRQNILEPDVTDIGVGTAQNAATGAYVAVELFGRPRSMQIRFAVANQTDDTIEYTVGTEPFTVPPSAIRTHEVCRPAVLELRGAAASHGPRQPFSLRGGERLSIVRAADGSIDVQVSQ